MSHSTTTIRRSGNPEVSGFRSFVWMSMLMSLGVVFFGMQLMMVGPLKGRLEGIQTRLDTAEHSMKKLVATRDTVWKTNDLLTGLEEQSTRLDSLSKSISGIQSLRNTLQREAESSSVAMAALDRMAGVQERLLQQENQTRDAARQLDAIAQLHQSIITGAPTTEVASTSLDGLVALQNRLIAASNGYDEANAGIAQLTELTHRLAEQSDDLVIAARKFDEFVGLKNAVQTASADLAEAHASVAGLNSLKQELVAATSDLATAQENTRTLVAMNDTLASTMPLESARQNLDALLALQQGLGEQSEEISAAIQNLEIMDDFRGEVAAHIRSLDSLRHAMMELAMMESTLGRVAQVIEPLAEIGNLRRLNDEEIREAARVILDRRATRYSQSEPAVPAETVSDSTRISGELSDETPVPLPPEARN